MRPSRSIWDPVPSPLTPLAAFELAHSLVEAERSSRPGREAVRHALPGSSLSAALSAGAGLKWV